MKSLFWAASGILLFSTPALAGPAALFGVSYNFQSENSLGFTVKLLSNDIPNNVVLGAGITYYPLAKTKSFGADVSAGYVFQNVAITGGYDLVKNEPQVTLGYVNTRSTSIAAPAAPVVVPPTDTIPGGGI